MPKEIVLIDFSSIAYPIWSIIETEVRKGAPHPPDHAANQMVDRVRKFSSNCEHVAICCDSGRSFRADIDDTYKGTRKEKDAVFVHQMKTALDTLREIGFPVWAVPTFEADDLIASAACYYTQALDDVKLTIWSSDKDLWQLITPRVVCKLPASGAVMDSEGLVEKKGVFPYQMCDYLSLTGDAADNIKGAQQIGETKASALLAKFGSLDEIYEKLATQGAAAMGLQPAVVKSLEEFKSRRQSVRDLVSLRYDVAVPFDEVLVPRSSRRAPASFAFAGDEDAVPEQENTDVIVEPEITTPEQATIAEGLGAIDVQGVMAPPRTVAARPAAPVTAIAVHKPVEGVLVEHPAWEERSMAHIKNLAADAFKSNLFSAYGNPQAVYMVLLAGKERGLTPMQSLMSMHIVEGKPTLPADLIRALIIKSGAATYFRCMERSAERATFETQRGDDPPVSLTYTILEATAAGLVKDKSAWMKSPADMLVARASAKLARLVYPDVVHGLYDESEIELQEAA